MNQQYIPGLENAFGWHFEKLQGCTDYQSSSRADGYVQWWQPHFSNERPPNCGTIRNVVPVFLAGHA